LAPRVPLPLTVRRPRSKSRPEARVQAAVGIADRARARKRFWLLCPDGGLP